MSCCASAASICSGWASHARVDPSTSVNRKVTVPVGRSSFPSALMAPMQAQVLHHAPKRCREGFERPTMTYRAPTVNKVRGPQPVSSSCPSNHTVRTRHPRLRQLFVSFQPHGQDPSSPTTSALRVLPCPTVGLRFLRQPQHLFANDVALHLARTSVNRSGASIQERHNPRVG